MSASTDPTPSRPDASRWLVGWTLLAAAALGSGLGGPALIEPDEGRNAAIAMEMARSGELFLPRLEGLPFLDKPFLFFALVAGSIRLLGPAEAAIRLPALLSAWATVGLVGWFAARRLGRGAGWVAALALATTPLFAAFARIAIFDATLCLLVTAALVAFHCALEDGDPPAAPRHGSGWTLAAWTAMGLGVLVKGPVALAVPLLVVAPWAAWLGRLRRIATPLSMLAFVVLVAPWIWAVEREQPGFLRYALVIETWQRMTSDALERTEPVWFFLPFVLAGFFPWSVVALTGGAAGGRGLRRDAESRLVVYLSLWVLLPLLLFTLSRSKQPQYVLPLAPAVALLAARALRGRGVRRAALAGALGWVALAVPLLLAGLGVIPVETRVDPETSAGIYRVGILLGTAALGAAAAAWLLRRAPGARSWVLVSLTAPVVLFPWITARSLREIAEIRSSRGIAAALAERMTPASRLIGIETYSPTLSFYLDRRTLVSTGDGAPFRVNSMIHSYRSLVDPDRGSLRPAGWWRQALAECATPDFFVVERRWTGVRAELEAAGLEPFHEAFRLLAYGPCRAAPAPPAATGAGEGGKR